MPIYLPSVQVFCKDCGSVVENGDATIKITNMTPSGGVPVMGGSALTNGGKHHTKFKKIGKTPEETIQHNDMVLLVDTKRIGGFRGNSVADFVKFDVEDKEMAEKLGFESIELGREQILRRRGAIE